MLENWKRSYCNDTQIKCRRNILISLFVCTIRCYELILKYKLVPFKKHKHINCLRSNKIKQTIIDNILYSYSYVTIFPILINVNVIKTGYNECRVASVLFNELPVWRQTVIVYFKFYTILYNQICSPNLTDGRFRQILNLKRSPFWPGKT